MNFYASATRGSIQRDRIDPKLLLLSALEVRIMLSLWIPPHAALVLDKRSKNQWFFALERTLSEDEKKSSNS
ncbi:hypothetical protein QJS04_geneDACA007624 [Acorus gramineus]|uniref:Uncharacterized protein n=1 Tax=Acorus gramineus TaxID=55184 RepID=A0AAV9B4H1_ACOGR|nr:hypothetical protein QJS04_geneDACA007624 [Acorus gramineus]